MGQAIYNARQDGGNLEKLQNFFDSAAGRFWEDEEKEAFPQERPQGESILGI